MRCSSAMCSAAMSLIGQDSKCSKEAARWPKCRTGSRRKLSRLSDVVLTAFCEYAHQSKLYQTSDHVLQLTHTLLNDLNFQSDYS